MDEACTAAQEAMWLGEQLADPGDAGLTMAVAVTFPAGVRRAEVLGALERVWRAQPALRTRFSVRAGRLRRQVDEDATPDVATVEPDPADPAGDRAVAALLRRPLDLLGAVQRTTLLVRADGRLRLLVCAHHAVLDGTAKDVLAEQLLAALADPRRALPRAVDPAAAVVAERRAVAERAEAARAPCPPGRGRRAALAPIAPPRPAADDPVRGRPDPPPGASITLALDAAARDGTAAAAHALGTSRFVVLLLAAQVAELAARGWPAGGIATMIPLGTRDPAAAQTIGHFVNEVPILTELDPDWPVRRCAAVVDRQVRAAGALRAFPFPVAVARFAPRGDPRALRPVHGVSFRRSRWTPAPGVVVDRLLPVYGRGWATRLRFLETPLALAGTLEHDPERRSTPDAHAIGGDVRRLAATAAARCDAPVGRWARER